MRFALLLTLFVSFLSFSCVLTGEDKYKNHFLEAMNSNSLVVIGTVKRTYHRKDKCTVEKFCRSSGVVIHVDEILKGSTSSYIEGYTATYTSCFGDTFHPVNWEEIDGIAQRAPSYIVGKEYLFVLKQEKDDYQFLAGKKLELSLKLIETFRVN
ncbi:hypothetical protein J1N51_01960 [Psychrosphaera ytuae]|uniref:Lipoprotein n=1 Tax=Psychrosphaera ytuae TaxID=2820710 RepID=A0A975HIL0_9GAMM|nr:hypothetical protein [Psychrosphaera ytuae]QTH64273.1 hypothetical protein J1N51_01960 [Psychrosphaera ytuae]